MSKTVAQRLEEVEGHLAKDEFQPALRLLDALGAQSDLTDEVRIQSQLKRLYIYWRTGTEQDTRLQFANELIEITEALGEPLYIIEALFHKSAVLFLDNRREECKEILSQAETLIDKRIKQAGTKLTKAEKSKLFNLKAEILNSKGFLLIFEAELDQAIEPLTQSIKLFEKYPHWRDYSAIGNLGLVYGQKGDLEKARKYYEKGQQAAEKWGNKNKSALHLTMIGSLHTLKGNLQDALEVSEQSLKLTEECKGPSTSAVLIFNGELYWRLGDLDKATERLERGLKIEEETTTFGMHLQGSANYWLMQIAIDQKNWEKANHYLKRIKVIHDGDLANRWHSQRYRLAKATLLFTSPRLRDRGQAEDLLRQILDEKSVAQKITRDTLLHLCGSLLYELRLTGNPAVLKEIQELLARLREHAHSSSSYWLLAQTHVLQARLALVELDFTEVRNHLTQAQVIANDYQMGQLATEITQEYDMLMERLDRWEEYIAQKTSLEERTDILQIEALVSRMIYVRGSDLEDPLIRANVIAPDSFSANEEIRLAVDLINIGRKPGLAMRIEQMLPPRLTLIETQPEYNSEGGSVLLEGKLLGPMQTTSLSLRVLVDGFDSIELTPQVVYANLDGDFEVSHTKPIQIHPLLTFETELAQAVFEYLVDAFRQDTVRKSLRPEESGWRTRTQLLNDVPLLKKWHLYGSHGGYGSILQELLTHRIVEQTTEAGKRSRKGTQTKVRIAYQQEAVKQFVEQR